MAFKYRASTGGSPFRSSCRTLGKEPPPFHSKADFHKIRDATVAAPPTTETIHEDFDTTEFDTACTGAIVPIHITGKSVFHITEFEDGRYHLTGTQVGRFTTTDAGVTYTGRFTIWFGENSNSKTFNGTFTFSATGKGSDGSKIRISGVAHFTVNANGDVTSEFERFTVNC